MSDLLVDKKISHGAFGEVFVGEYRNVPVAIKRLSPQHRHDTRAGSRCCTAISSQSAVDVARGEADRLWRVGPDDDGELIDFGVSRERADQKMTASVGTLRWMASTRPTEYSASTLFAFDRQSSFRVNAVVGNWAARYYRVAHPVVSATQRQLELVAWTRRTSRRCDCRYRRIQRERRM
ncbi:hypothetical protein PINS_up011711 [Pythium insidiosum]|nr:hypothetical protein PINS_up011711 [Pythium insidiosum]